jgi:hypothetical protein
MAFPRMNPIDTALPIPGPSCMRFPEKSVCRIDQEKSPGTLHNAIECGVCEIPCLHHLPERKPTEEVFAFFGR